jgi:hypothetical protein
MKTLEELQALFIEMDEAYKTIGISDMEYDENTVVYAKKCRDDAETALQERMRKSNDQT